MSLWTSLPRSCLPACRNVDLHEQDSIEVEDDEAADSSPPSEPSASTAEDTLTNPLAGTVFLDLYPDTGALLGTFELSFLIGSTIQEAEGRVVIQDTMGMALTPSPHFFPSLHLPRPLQQGVAYGVSSASK
jgi:hypothetical protein